MSGWIGYIGTLGIGAVLTVIIQEFFKLWLHKRLWDDEIKKTVILKKLQVSEDAIVCLQSVIDELLQLKLICQVEKDVPLNYLGWCRNLENHTNALYSEVQAKLNRLGTYCDFSTIEKKHDIHLVMERFNNHVAELSRYSQHLQVAEDTIEPILIISGDTGKIEPLMVRIAADVESIISYAEEVQSVVRNDIGQYCR